MPNCKLHSKVFDLTGWCVGGGGGGLLSPDDDVYSTLPTVALTQRQSDF